MPPRHGTGKNAGPGKLLGVNADQRTGNLPKGAFNYTPTRGGPGKWTNRAGTQVGESDQEDSTIRGRKSTGDVPLNISAIKKYRKAKLATPASFRKSGPERAVGDLASAAGRMLGHAVGNASKYLGL
jgi:hypothetical protein